MNVIPYFIDCPICKHTTPCISKMHHRSCNYFVQSYTCVNCTLEFYIYLDRSIAENGNTLSKASDNWIRDESLWDGDKWKVSKSRSSQVN